MPAFFYLGTYQAGLWFILPGLIFGILCGAVLFTWLYNGTGDSVLAVVVWHALCDLLTVPILSAPQSSNSSFASTKSAVSTPSLNQA